MIKSVLSSAAELSRAPVRLARRMGSLVRGLRGNSAPPTRTRRPSPARAKSPSRSRATAQRKRATSRTQAKAQPKRAAPRARAKAEPTRTASRTRAKAEPTRTASRARAKAQPKRTPRPKPLDDVAIARKVESTIFRGVEVDKGAVDVNVAAGVLSLRGVVPTEALIKELEARANQVTEVRRVDNQLRLPTTPAPTRTEPPTPTPERRRPPAGPAAGGPEGDESAKRDEPEAAELHKDSTR